MKRIPTEIELNFESRCPYMFGLIDTDAVLIGVKLISATEHVVPNNEIYVYCLHED